MALAAVALVPGTAPPALARFNPLEAIARQVEKANMLVVLDTSGSMTNTPGGAFAGSSEVGVDCDDGQDCRTLSQSGVCASTKNPDGTPRFCSNNDDCREGVCQDGNDLTCRTDSDCPLTAGGSCSQAPNGPCQYNSDCGPVPGYCSIAGSCNSALPCSGNVCQSDGAACNNPGSSCNPRRCFADKTKICTTNSDCYFTDKYPTSGMAGWWDFSTSDMHDFSPNLHNGTAVGSAYINTSKELTLNGTTDYMNVPAPSGSSLDLSGAYSIALWINRTTARGTGYFTDYVVHRRHNLAGNGLLESLGMGFWDDKLSVINTCHNDSGTPGTYTGVSYDLQDTAVWPTGWHHAAITYDGSSTWKLYRDGYVVATKTGVAPPCAGSAPWFMGAQIDGTTVMNYFGGRLIHIIAYNRELSQAEVQGFMYTCDPNTCIPAAGNTCCAIGPGPCAPLPSNVCQPSTVVNKCINMNPTDVCTVKSGVTAPIKMCRIAMTVCTFDTDCSSKTPGDTCGPATSREVIAKRVIKNVLVKNQNLMNFGLMTFTQSGYFPYAPLAGTSTAVSDDALITREQLRAAGCWTRASGPTATCTIAGTSYTLRTSQNSRYVVRTSQTGNTKVDQNWCGLYCVSATGEGEGFYT